MKRLSLLCLALSLGACQARSLPEQAASTPQLFRGHAYAQAACSSCHAIGAGSTSSPNPQAPPFAAIVNRDGLSGTSLAAWLRDAHNYPGEMAFQLDASMLDDLVTYMLTLRDPEYQPAG